MATSSSATFPPTWSPSAARLACASA